MFFFYKVPDIHISWAGYVVATDLNERWCSVFDDFPDIMIFWNLLRFVFKSQTPILPGFKVPCNVD